MNLKHLFFLAVAGTLAVACSEVNENSLTDGDGQRITGLNTKCGMDKM